MILLERPPRGYGEQGNLPFLLKGTREHLVTFKELLLKRTTFKELGNISTFLFREYSTNIIGNKGDFLIFFREHGNPDPPGGPH